MIRAISAALALLGLVACSSSPPQPSAAPAPDQTVTMQGAAAPAGPSEPAAATPPATSEADADDESGLHVIDVPPVTQSAPQPVASNEPHPDELVCKRIKVTGSHRLQRICRTRAQIEEARAAAQAMHRSVTSSPDGVRAVDSTSRTMSRPSIDSQ